MTLGSPQLRAALAPRVPHVSPSPTLCKKLTPPPSPLASYFLHYTYEIKGCKTVCILSLRPFIWPPPPDPPALTTLFDGGDCRRVLSPRIFLSRIYKSPPLPPISCYYSTLL